MVRPLHKLQGRVPNIVVLVRLVTKSQKLLADMEQASLDWHWEVICTGTPHRHIMLSQAKRDIPGLLGKGHSPQMTFKDLSLEHPEAGQQVLLAVQE